MRPEKFVVLEYLKGESKGVRFFCFNRPDNTHTADGDLGYKEVGFTDDVKQAQALCQEHDIINHAVFIRNLVKQAMGGN